MERDIKKVREWYKELPEPYATQAKDNYERRNLITEPVMSSVRSAIGAFSWKESPEGYDYWYKIHKII